MAEHLIMHLCMDLRSDRPNKVCKIRLLFTNQPMWLAMEEIQVVKLVPMVSASNILQRLLTHLKSTSMKLRQLQRSYLVQVSVATLMKILVALEEKVIELVPLTNSLSALVPPASLWNMRLHLRFMEVVMPRLTVVFMIAVLIITEPIGNLITDHILKEAVMSTRTFQDQRQQKMLQELTVRSILEGLIQAEQQLVAVLLQIIRFWMHNLIIWINQRDR